MLAGAADHRRRPRRGAGADGRLDLRLPLLERKAYVADAAPSPTSPKPKPPTSWPAWPTRSPGTTSAITSRTTPTISDADYDALKRRNAEIEARFPHLIRENSPSLRVGAARAEQFSPVEHGVPMLSLDNAFADEEAVEFDARIRRFLRLGERDGRLHRRAEDRRPVVLDPLREGRAGPGGHPRRRPGRRGRHRQRPHHRRRSPSGWRAPAGPRSSRSAARSTWATRSSRP